MLFLIVRDWITSRQVRRVELNISDHEKGILRAMREWIYSNSGESVELWEGDFLIAIIGGLNSCKGKR